MLIVVLLAIMVFFTVIPVLLVIGMSLEGEGGFTLENWQRTFARPGFGEALWNTFTLSFVRQLIGTVLGIGIAWLLARTNIPGAQVLEYGFWIAVFLPSLTVTLSWILVFDPKTGFANSFWTALGLGEGPFNIYSWWGIVWVQLLSSTLPIKVMLLTPLLRNLDSTYEEASRSTGASDLRTMWKITARLIAPTVLVTVVLGLIRGLEAFEVELILGLPARIDVISTMLYRTVRSNPPDYGGAAVIAVFALLVMIPVVLMQRWYSEKNSFATVSGKFRSDIRPLGRAKWPAFVIVCAIVLTMTVLPIAMLVMGSFMKFFGFFGIADPWTLDHWTKVVTGPTFGPAFFNSMVISVGTAILAMVVFSAIAYLLVRQRFRGRAGLDFMVWLPSLLPGVVLGLAYVVFFLRVPFLRPLYGTLTLLLVVTALGVMTLSVQMLKGSITQIGTELEEASSSVGAGWLYTFRKVVLPIVGPSVIVVGVLAFTAAARTTGLLVLLSTGKNQPLSVLQLSQMADGNLSGAAVVGVFLLLMSVGVAAIARMFGYQAKGM
ncbi:iron(III) transport system permease protein [Arthrobacter ginsengisoli]|uniref:Iron(III) transport system permease protein n=1 Tax=Arthrobacter ginsengisoli TaxID=1356565 RepID=A0ABU1UDR0_9MICC|nr:iron ABC transporter permease [Arthrobacter ginsengisoli]MDR7083288.1 iron(III) transport system permease protein [Arthrobacter ginsengisoli]